jgi:endonuclease-8
MPEGHVIHRQAERQSKVLVGHRLVVSSPQGRFAEAQRLDGRVLASIEALGKHLVYTFEGDEPRRIHVHLGLFGKFRQHRAGDALPAPTPTVRLRLVGPSHAIDLVGPTICALLDARGLRALRARLGPDLLGSPGNVARAAAALAKTRTAIGAALLDPARVGGVGNIYRAEALFSVGLHPSTPANAIAPATLRTLVGTLREMMLRGVREGRIVTAPRLDPDVPPPRGRRARREALMIYGKRECRVCGEPVARWTLRARTIYACERCQPPLDETPAPASVGAAKGGSGRPSKRPAAATPER